MEQAHLPVKPERLWFDLKIAHMCSPSRVKNTWYISFPLLSISTWLGFAVPGASGRSHGAPGHFDHVSQAPWSLSEVVGTATVSREALKSRWSKDDGRCLLLTQHCCVL